MRATTVPVVKAISISHNFVSASQTSTRPTPHISIILSSYIHHLHECAWANKCTSDHGSHLQMLWVIRGFVSADQQVHERHTYFHSFISHLYFHSHSYCHIPKSFTLFHPPKFMLNHTYTFRDKRVLNPYHIHSFTLVKRRHLNFAWPRSFIR